MKKLILMLACPAVLLCSCGNSAPSALKEDTEKVLSNYIEQNKAAALKELAVKAEAGEVADIEAFLAELMPALMQASRADGGAKEAEVTQLMVDWIVFGSERGSASCQVVLYLLKMQQNKGTGDSAMSAVTIPGDLDDLKSDASDAVKKLEAKQDCSKFEKEALGAGKMLGL